MPTFSIHYYAIDTKHIDLKSDGTISLYNGETVIEIDYGQARILKAMIIAEYKLNKKEIKNKVTENMEP